MATASHFLCGGEWILHKPIGTGEWADFYLGFGEICERGEGFRRKF